MINIDDKYFIVTDEQNYILCDKRKPAKKRVIGYYGKLDSLLRALMGYWARDTFAETDAELTDAIKQILEQKKKYEALIISALDGV